MVIASNDKKVWWKGKCGHDWESSIIARTKAHNPTGCPYCTGKKALKGFNDLETKFPKLAKEWDYDKKVYGDDSEFHSVSPNVSSSVICC